MSVFVKICGLARQEDVFATAALQPDAMGFVFYARSPRAVTPSQVAGWTENIPAGILKVGVFVDHSSEQIQSIVREAGLDVAQFHGAYAAEEMEQVQALRWRVLHDTALPDLPLRHCSDAYLLDTAVAGQLGGTGVVGDWSAAKEFMQIAEKSVWLAGGLQPDNVADAIREVAPSGVDVSSGVEARPGVKDMDKVKQFIERSRSA